MNKILRLSFVTLMGMMFGSTFAAEVTDVLTWEGLGLTATNSNYADFADKTFSSSAVYAGQASSGTGKYIQLRTNKNNAGIITTTSGGKLKSVTITFNEATTDRSIEIYGKNTAYAAATELYGDAAGDKLGTIAANGESMTLLVDGDYTFVGLRSASGAIYIDQISIVWDGEVGPVDEREATQIMLGDGYQMQVTCGKDENPSLAPAIVMAGDVEVADAVIEWSMTIKNWSTDAEDEQPVLKDGKVIIPNHVYGQLQLTAEYAGNDKYLGSKASYTLTVYKGATNLQEMWEQFNNKSDVLSKGMYMSYFPVNLSGDGSFTPREELVTYANGLYTYVTDGEFGMLFYGSNLGLREGEKFTVSGATPLYGIYGTLKIYNGLLELAVTDLSYEVTSQDNEVTPKVVTEETLKTLDEVYKTEADDEGSTHVFYNNNVFVNNYLKVENAVYVSTEGKNFKFMVGETELTVYNQWGADIAFEENETYDLTGMGSIYKGTYQLYFIGAEKSTPTGISELTTAVKAQDNAVYNLKGQRVEKAVKGLYIQNGKKYVK